VIALRVLRNADSAPALTTDCRLKTFDRWLEYRYRVMRKSVPATTSDLPASPR